MHALHISVVSIYKREIFFCPSPFVIESYEIIFFNGDMYLLYSLICYNLYVYHDCICAVQFNTSENTDEVKCISNVSKGMI